MEPNSPAGVHNDRPCRSCGGAATGAGASRGAAAARLHHAMLEAASKHHHDEQLLKRSMPVKCIKPATYSLSVSACRYGTIAACTILTSFL